MATAFVLGTVLGLLLLWFVACAASLRLGCALVGIRNVSVGGVVAAAVPIAVFNWLPVPLLNHAREFGALLLPAALVMIAPAIGLAWLVAAFVVRASLWRVIAAWFATLPAAAALWGLSLLVIRPYVVEVFTTPSNSMAPTILGRHWQAPCPRCGSPAYCTAESREVLPNQSVFMICSRELRTCQVADVPRTVYAGDKFVVNKLLRPRRWDVIVFRSPERPEVLFCSRLVGLPGETLVIRDGAVWIGGKKRTPPAGLQGITYLDRIAGYPCDSSGTEARPAKLGPDEYFVLGDFSACALDSRLWQTGARGHPPYALPASHIVGVVTHIYWPPERMRAFR
jgi:signal peptidase I